MQVLFIGGTGKISTAVSRLAVARGIDLYHLNRAKRGVAIDSVRSLVVDIHQPEQAREALGDQRFDVVVDWIAFSPEQIEVDLNLFRGRTGQYLFISSASVYQKPLRHYLITESTPLANPYWEYSRNKIAAVRIKRLDDVVKLALVDGHSACYGKSGLGYRLRQNRSG